MEEERHEGCGGEVLTEGVDQSGMYGLCEKCGLMVQLFSLDPEQDDPEFKPSLRTEGREN